MTDASDRGWGPGWPVDRSRDMVTLRFEGVEFPAGVHRTVAPLMYALLDESSRWIDPHPLWCWGYANRPIKLPNGGFTNTPSNHSWGLAIDLNAPENPFGGSSHTIPEAMGELWEAYGFRWGGNYSGTRDWMHFEFMGTPAQVKVYLAKLQETEDDMNMDEYQRGWDAYVVAYKSNRPPNTDPGPPKADRPAWFRNGWNAARFSATNPR
jgi:hypothetical protein